MSARVFKPIPQTEMHRIRSSPTIDGNFCNFKGVQKVRRTLFAIPDPEETKKFLKEEFAKLESINCEKWDFDFVVGKPTNITRRYEWTAINEKSNTNIPNRPTKHLVTMHEDSDDLYAPIASSSTAIISEDEMQEEMATEPVDQSTSTELPKKQSLITDFMQARKRIEETSFKKKIDTSSTSRPKKMARMSLADSAS